MSLITPIFPISSATSGIKNVATSGADNIVASNSDSYPAASFRGNSGSGPALHIWGKPASGSITNPMWEFKGTGIFAGPGTGAIDTTVLTRQAAGLLTMGAGLGISSMPSNVSPLTVTGSQPSAVTGLGTAAQGISITGGVGGNNTASGSAGGTGGHVTIAGGAGGNAVSGSFNGNGGNVILSPGAAGTGGGGTATQEGEIVITRGKMRVGSTALVDRDSLTVNGAGSVVIAGKLAPYNPLEHGCVGDGTTDDTVNLQACVDAAAGKGAVFLPPNKTFLITQLDLPSNTYIYGAGYSSCIKGKGATATSGGGSADPCRSEFIRNSDATNGNSNITLDNFRFDLNWNNGTPTIGKRPSGGGGQIGTRCNATNKWCNNVHFRNLYVHDSPSLTLLLATAENSSITNCVVQRAARDGCGTYHDSRFCRIVNNTIRDVGDDSIAVHSRSPISNQAWADANAGGVTQSGPTPLGGHDITVTGNVCVGSFAPGNGVNITGSYRVSVTGNVFQNIYHNGVHIRNNNLVPSFDITIDSNIFVDCGLPYSTNDSFSCGLKLSIENAGFYGAGGISEVRDVNITGNVVDSPDGAGIHVAGISGGVGCAFVNIVGNRLRGFNRATSGFASAGGVYNANASTSFLNIANNQISDWMGPGINLGGARWADIDGNQIISCCKGSGYNGTAAILLSNAQKVGVKNNRVHDVSSPKIYQAAALDWGTASGVMVSNNDFEGNRVTTYNGTKSGTAKEIANFDNNGVLQNPDGGGSSSGGATTASVEDLMVSAHDRTSFGTPTNGTAGFYPIFVAQVACKIVAASFVNGTAVAANNTNYYSMTIQQYRGGSLLNTLVTKTTQLTGGEAVAANTNWSFNNGPTWADIQILPGDLIRFNCNTVGTPTTAFTDPMVTVKYTPT